MGHTADDLIEAAAMRAGRRQRAVAARLVAVAGLAGGPRRLPAAPAAGACAAPSCAPGCAALGETWIDDPANDDPRFARARARRRRAGRADADRAAGRRGAGAVAPAWARSATGSAGELAAPRRAGRAPRRGAPRPSARWRSARPARRAPAAGARWTGSPARLAAGDDFTATLAGARIEAAAERSLFCREAGERVRGGSRPAPLPLGRERLGRPFRARRAPRPGCASAPLAGLRRATAGRAERPRAARRIAGRRRAARLPAVISPDRRASLARSLHGDAAARDAVGADRSLARLRRALGRPVGDEAALWRVAKLTAASLD